MGGAASTVRQATNLDPLDISTSILLGPYVRSCAKFVAHSDETRRDFLQWVCGLSWLDDFLAKALANEFKRTPDADRQLHYIMPSGSTLFVDDRAKTTHRFNHSVKPCLSGDASSQAAVSTDERTIRSINIDIETPSEALNAAHILPLLLASLLPLYFQSSHFGAFVSSSLAPNGRVKVRSATSLPSPSAPTPSSTFTAAACYLTDPESVKVNGAAPRATATASAKSVATADTKADGDSQSTARLRTLLLQTVERLRVDQPTWTDKLRHPHSAAWLSSVLLYLDELPISISLASASPLTPNFPLIYVNQAFEHTTLYARHEIIGRNCRFLQHSQRTEHQQVDVLCQALRERCSVRLALTNRRKDGSCFLNFLALQPIDGREKYVLGIQHDFTGRESRLTQDLLAVDLLAHLLPPLMR